jgi:hypothetical protein
MTTRFTPLLPIQEVFASYTLHKLLKIIHRFKSHCLVQCGEMPAAASDLGAFGGTKGFGADIGLGLQHEIEFFFPVLLDQDRPVRVIAAEGCGNLKPIRKFGI